MAPGAAIVGALSQQSVAGGVPVTGSVFSGNCPPEDGDNCQVIDPLHGISFGTSFSAPIVSGAVAVLFQRDPTVTQDTVLAALQGGAHRLRGPAPFDDQAGPGEVDVVGAVAALDRIRHPQATPPVRSESWLTLGADEYLADGSTPLRAVFELRSARGTALTAPVADGFDSARFAPYARIGGRSVDAAALTTVRRGPGVQVSTLTLPAGMGGSSLTIGATFDGVPVVDEKTIPIATDTWSAAYPPTVRGGCATAPPTGAGLAAYIGSGSVLGLVLLAGVFRAARRRA
jgi:hypothetical protein